MRLCAFEKRRLVNIRLFDVEFLGDLAVEIQKVVIIRKERIEILALGVGQG